MIRTLSIFTAAALATLVSLGAQAAPPQPQPTDLTPVFLAAGIDVNRLQVFEIGGVVVIRGRVTDPEAAAAAGRYATSLGYRRVANLVQIMPPPDDGAIKRAAERRLMVHRGLGGCRFLVASNKGIVSIGGSVRHELQKDVAVSVVRNIDGVRGVETSLDLH
ncbi:MAG TPA: BON domain-containing protein [Thermoanaerobaculia bacterium]|nr:BON domain-containing protein [Thermoanaerobaculia bacterium]